MNFSLDSRIAFLISLTRSPVFSCCSLRFFRTIIFNCLSRKSQLPVSWGHLLEVSCLAVAASASLMFVTPAALRRCLCRWRGPSFQARGTDSGEKKSSWEGGEHWSSRAGHRVETCGSCDSGSPWLSQPGSKPLIPARAQTPRLSLASVFSLELWSLTLRVFCENFPPLSTLFSFVF